MEPQTALPQANPYAAPRAQVEDVGGEAQLELAGRRQRLGAAFVDSILFALCGFLTTAGMGVIAAVFGSLGLVALLGVNVWLLHRNGQSVGKYSFDIGIVRSDGEPAGLARLIFIRGLPQWLVGAIPFLNLLTLVDVLFIFRADRRCLHDLIADTIVVSIGK